MINMVYKQIHLSAYRRVLLISSSVLWIESKALHLLGMHSTPFLFFPFQQNSLKEELMGVINE